MGKKQGQEPWPRWPVAQTGDRLQQLKEGLCRFRGERTTLRLLLTILFSQASSTAAGPELASGLWSRGLAAEGGDPADLVGRATRAAGLGKVIPSLCTRY